MKEKTKAFDIVYSLLRVSSIAAFQGKYNWQMRMTKQQLVHKISVPNRKNSPITEKVVFDGFPNKGSVQIIKMEI